MTEEIQKCVDELHALSLSKHELNEEITQLQTRLVTINTKMASLENRLAHLNYMLALGNMVDGLHKIGAKISDPRKESGKESVN
mgnify:CR=1 FL=1